MSDESPGSIAPRLSFLISARLKPVATHFFFKQVFTLHFRDLFDVESVILAPSNNVDMHRLLYGVIPPQAFQISKKVLECQAIAETLIEQERPVVCVMDSVMTKKTVPCILAAFFDEDTARTNSLDHLVSIGEGSDRFIVVATRPSTITNMDLGRVTAPGTLCAYVASPDTMSCVEEAPEDCRVGNSKMWTPYGDGGSGGCDP